MRTAEQNANLKKTSKRKKQPMTSDPKERLFILCRELDMEMDGVRVPATAAAILNAIRSIITERE